MLRIHPNRIMIRNIHGIEYTYEKEYTFDRGCWYDVRMKTYGTMPGAGRMHVWVVRNPEATEVNWAEVDNANTPPIITTGASPLGTTSNQYTFIRFGGAAAHTANSMQIRFFRQWAYPSACADQPDPLLPDYGGILEVTPSAEQTVVTLAGESKEIVYTLKNTKTGLNTDGTIPRLDVSVSLSTGAPFSVAGNLRYVLGPGQEQQVPITFAPTVARTEPYTATVTFVSGYYSESRTISAYADDPAAATADVRITPTLVQFGYVPIAPCSSVERQITLYNYGNQAISGKAILPTEPTLYFRIKKLEDAEDAYYPNPPIVDYTLPAATVEGETVDPGTQTFDVRLTQNFTSPQVYSRDILFTGWGGATCTVSASTVPGAVGSGSSTAVRINEFMLKNTRGLQDEFGRYVQWIEFYNTDMTQTVDLSGWQFTATDRNGDPATWTFPSATIAPGGYLVAMASDAAPPTQYLNTGFPLDEQEGALALRNATGALSGMDEPLQYTADGSTDISFCHSSDTGMFTLTKTPTPYRANKVTKATFYSGYYMREGDYNYCQMEETSLGWKCAKWPSGTIETIDNTWFGEIANIATRWKFKLKLAGNMRDDNCPGKSHPYPFGTYNCYQADEWFKERSVRRAVGDRYTVLQINAHATPEFICVYWDDTPRNGLTELRLTAKTIAEWVDDVVPKKTQQQPEAKPLVKMVFIYGCESGRGTEAVMAAFRPLGGGNWDHNNLNPYAALVLGWRDVSMRSHLRSFERHFWWLIDGQGLFGQDPPGSGAPISIKDAVNQAQIQSMESWWYLYDMTGETYSKPDLKGTEYYQDKTREWLYEVAM